MDFESNTKKYERHGYEGVVEWKLHEEGQDLSTDTPRVGLWMSYRFMVALCCMMCMLSSFASQTSMSSAMVCMIRQGNTSNWLDTPLSVNSSEQFMTHGINHTEKYDMEEFPQPWLFDWTPETQGWIIASFFVCYFITQTPSGLLVSRYGAKHVLVVSQIISGLGHLLTVPATQLGLPYVYAARIIAGLSTGCLFTSTFALLAMWAPRHEASLLFGLAGVGIEGGNTFSFGISMFACEIPFQGGWPIVFYAMGGIQILMAIFVIWRLTDFPSENSYISRQEAIYIERGVAGKGNKGKKTIPMRRILTSMCVYAIVVSQCGTFLMYYTFITQGPIYLRDVIHLSSFQINLLSSVPFIIVIPLVYALGAISDWLVGSGTLSTTSLRKMNDGLCKIIGIAALVCLNYVPEYDMTSSFLSYSLVALSVSFGYTSFFPNAGDLSPAHLGFTSSVVQTGSLWVSFVIPPVIGSVVQDRSRENWTIVFFVEISIQALAYLFYLMFGSAQLQPWAFDETYDVIVPNTDLENGKLGTRQVVGSSDEKMILDIGTILPRQIFAENNSNNSIVIDEKTALLYGTNRITIKS